MIKRRNFIIIAACYLLDSNLAFAARSVRYGRRIDDNPGPRDSGNSHTSDDDKKDDKNEDKDDDNNDSADADDDGDDDES